MSSLFFLDGLIRFFGFDESIKILLIEAIKAVPGEIIGKGRFIIGEIDEVVL
jgi:hypothetical protein